MATAVLALDGRKRKSPDMSGIRSMVALTKSDTDELANVSKGIFCSVAGSAALVFADDLAAGVVVLPLLAGTYYPFEIKQFMATSTTTAALFACY